MPEIFEKIFINNKKWVQEKLEQDPNYFIDLAKGQNPPILWIGCSDSRVPANEITGTKPGEIFVHRNIANMVIHTDMNMLSVLDYAVNALKVRHVIVCGHYGCGGVHAAYDNLEVGIIDNWLRHIKDVYRFHQIELDKIQDRKEKLDRFVEVNVEEQVFDLAKTSIIQNAWKNGQDLYLHGLVYDLSNGLLKDLEVNISSDTDMNQIHKFKNIHSI
ncbi:MAG TPA: carbonate dehydratase [Bacteroidia bacterium]